MGRRQATLPGCDQVRLVTKEGESELLKSCSSSSGCESRPAKAEPGRPEARKSPSPDPVRASGRQPPGATRLRTSIGTLILGVVGWLLLSPRASFCVANFCDVGAGGGGPVHAQVPQCTSCFGIPDGSACSMWGGGSPVSFIPTATSPVYTIPVVWHILIDGGLGGPGDISDQLIADNMSLLNDGFNARPGSHAANGFNCKIEFVLASVNRVTNHADWLRGIGPRNAIDSIVGATQHWDTNRYLNVVTQERVPPNDPSGSFSNWAAYPWFTFWPYWDGPRIQWYWVGDPNNGRVLIHETGHMFGLYHTGTQLCSPTCASDGYSTGDLVADTPVLPFGVVVCDGSAGGTCQNPAQVCGQTYPLTNYLTTGTSPFCWYTFTPEQAGRMRCALQSYRSSLYLGITESSIQATITQFCEGAVSEIRFSVSWNTNLPTTGPDSLKVYAPGATCSGATSLIATSTPASATTVHGLSWTGTCSPGAAGAWRYTIKTSENTTLQARTTRSECRPVGAVSCPSCGHTCSPSPCELE